jgi:Ca-activated chloride channel family protein
MDRQTSGWAFMIEFAWPWVFACLPLPWLLRRLLPTADPGDAALRVPFLDEVEQPDPRRPAGFAHTWMYWLGWIAWLLLVVAGARPQWLGEPVEQAISGRDLMLAVDLSGSMQMEDFILDGEQVDRLTATKRVAGQFLDRRVGDRIGLVLFGDRAYLQAPLTFDRKTVKTLLNEAVIGLAGEKTAIGDAIGLGVKRLRDNPADQRVLILLSDGANTAGTVSPLKAAELAAQAGLKIYTIGVGADEILVRDLFGTRRVNPSEDLDEQAMRSIAESTGGRYFRARDTEELAKIYALLDKLEPVERETRYFRPRTELYPWPLAAALALAGGLAFARIRESTGALSPE